MPLPPHLIDNALRKGDEIRFVLHDLASSPVDSGCEERLRHQRMQNPGNVMSPVIAIHCSHSAPVTKKLFHNVNLQGIRRHDAVPKLHDTSGQRGRDNKIMLSPAHPYSRHTIFTGIPKAVSLAVADNERGAYRILLTKPSSRVPKEIAWPTYGIQYGKSLTRFAGDVVSSVLPEVSRVITHNRIIAASTSW